MKICFLCKQKILRKPKVIEVSRTGTVPGFFHSRCAKRIMPLLEALKNARTTHLEYLCELQFDRQRRYRKALRSVYHPIHF